MMYYNRAVRMPKPSRMRVSLSAFSGIDADKCVRTLPCDWTDTCYNFGFRNGKLVAGTGIAPLQPVDPVTRQPYPIPTMPPTKATRNLFVARNANASSGYTTLVVSDKNGLEILPATKGANWQHVSCPHPVKQAISYLHEDKDLLLMSGDFDGILIWDGDKVTEVASALRVLSLCVHEERVFAVVQDKRNEVWFSSAFDPYNWNVSAQEGGYIAFDGTLGSVRVVKSLGEYLYIFCDYGIYRLSVYADQSQFVLKKVYHSCDRIYAASIVDCKDTVAFASAQGVHLFDGYRVSRLAVRLGDIMPPASEDISGVYADECYYLSIADNRVGYPYVSLDGAQGKYALLTVDLRTKQMSLARAGRLRSLQPMVTPLQSCAVGLSDDTESVVTLDQSGNCLGRPPARLWRVNNIDFGKNMQEKVIRNIEYSTTATYVFGVVADGVVREFVLPPNRHQVQIQIKARVFDFYIRSDASDVEIDAPVLTVDVLERAYG